LNKSAQIINKFRNILIVQLKIFLRYGVTSIGYMGVLWIVRISGNHSELLKSNKCTI